MQTLSTAFSPEPADGPGPVRLAARFELVGCTPTIALSGELDAGSGHVLIDAVPVLTALCTTARADDTARGLVSDAAVVVDAAGLTFVDAAGLGALIAVRHELALSGYGLRVVHPSARLRRLSAICALDHVLGLIAGPSSGTIA